MPNEPGFASRLALSLYKKEATYNAGVALTDAEACEMNQFSSEPPDWPDELHDDAGDTTGSEFPTTQEILTQKVTIPYEEPRAKPNSVAGLAALVMGNVASVQDGAVVAYRHKVIPMVNDGSAALPTIRAESKAGAQQYVYRGVFGRKFSLKGEMGAYLQLGSELGGSGYRANSATAFPAKVVESWIRCTQMKCWLETGANISLDANPVQGAESISSAAADDLKIRLRSFAFEFDGKPDENAGFGGNGQLQEVTPGPQRAATLSFTLRYLAETELAYYTAQDRCAFELDIMGSTLIAVGGAYYPGLRLRIPALQLKKVGKKGKTGDWLTQDFETLIMSDGTNPVVELWVYNAKAAYLAA
jgi:hypothetical protein